MGRFVRWCNRYAFGPGWIEGREGDCHLWTGSVDSNGYGAVKVNGRKKNIHRARYERDVGAVPKGMELDHFLMPDRCSRLCCNPAHLRVVPVRHNRLRCDSPPARNVAKTHCRKGHPFVEGNLLDWALVRGHRSCKICDSERQKRNKMRLRARRRAAGLTANGVPRRRAIANISPSPL